MRALRAFSTIVLVLIGASGVLGRTIVVPQDYASIQEAIDAGDHGDTIIVQPGTYEESIAFNGKNLTVRSEDPNDPAIVAATILRAPAQRRGVSPTTVIFADGEGPEAVLSGFTITGGGGTAPPDEPTVYLGGGVLCVEASPTITMNVITGNVLPMPAGSNQSEGYGGAVGCLNSDAVITRNVMWGNTAYAGGAVFAQGGMPRIENNLIYDNTAVVGGGACLIFGGDLANNTLSGNEAEVGGNVYCVSEAASGYCRVVSNILSESRGSEDLYHEGYHPEDVIAFNNVWRNATGAAVASAAAVSESANISADPLFVDPAQRDYRLRMDSPCINAGDPETSSATSLDIYGNARIMHGRIDIGASEYSGNLRPVAMIAENPSTEQLPDVVVLDGSDSHDPDGDTELTYRWTQVRGPEVVLEDADGPVAQFSPGTYGAFAFELVVGDGQVESPPARVQFILGTGHVPVAHAGRPAYATTDPVTLDGSASVDPDTSGTLSYAWRQISGPTLGISGADTATPIVGDFTRTNLPQRCTFELIVSDGEHDSFPDVVDVVVIPEVSGTTMRLENRSFDPNKPTVVYFGGGDCITGGGGWNSQPWMDGANVITWNYSPDGPSTAPRYERCGDILLGYLAQMAPDYRQRIQTMGHSTGGQPAIDVATYLNLVYRDARYAVNRVTFLDARCRDYSTDTARYLASAVDGEQCWIDTYEGTGPLFYPNLLNVQVAQNDHGFPPTWYRESLTAPSMNEFNHGLVAGAYWSVIGPGKNLQLASTPGGFGYQFRWSGSSSSGTMGFFDEALHPGRLPEPVTLVGPLGTGTAGEVILTCEPSENAVRYELLLGSDPWRVMDYNVVAETEGPPDAVVTELAFEQMWWTVRAYDAYGSSIYADPMPLTAFSMSLPVENATQDARYGFIQQAIDEAEPGDEIVLNEGTYHEDIDFQGKSLIVRSLDPNAPGAAMTTIIQGTGTAVTFSGVDAGGTLAGVTITGGVQGILCSAASPTITRCRIVGVAGHGIDLREGARPSLSHCLIADNDGDGVSMASGAGGRALSFSRPMLVNCTVAGNGQTGINGGAPTLANCIVYANDSSIEGAPANVSYSDIEGGWPGEGNIDADPQWAGDYHLRSVAGRWDSLTQSWVQDDVSSPCIDAGDPGLDVLDEPDPNGGRINMGAHGGTREASKSPQVN